MNAYNPQEWSRNTAPNGSHVRHSRRSFTSQIGAIDGITGMEAALPSPPPPYLPAPTSATMNASSFRQSPSIPQVGHSQRTSPTFSRPRYSPPAGLIGNGPVASASHTPLQQVSPTLFPPPPSGQRDRSGSRARGVINNISAWAARHKASEPASLEPGFSISQPASFESFARASVTTPVTLNSVNPPIAPPSTRRAVSVGYPGPTMPHSREASRTRYVASKTSAWEPGMPLPPPPPGPPPGGRSQSLGRTGHASGVINHGSVTPPHQIRNGTTLGSIPPTPVGWTEENDIRLYIMQTAADTESISEENARVAQRRDGSPKSIRERRNESRARSRHGQETAEPSSSRAGSLNREVARPADLVLSTDSNLMVRRRRVTKPHNGQRSDDTIHPNSGISPYERHILGREKEPADTLGYNVPRTAFVLTPPFSPEVQSKALEEITQGNFTTSIQDHNKRSLLTSFDANPCTDRSPIGAETNCLDDRSEKSLEQYKLFLDKEQSEADQCKKLILFAEFMVKEFQMRSLANPEAFATTREMLQRMVESLWSVSEHHVDMSTQNPPNRVGKARRKPSLPLNTTNLADGKYEPILSPILSTVLSKDSGDDSDTRGRPSSRWWESSTSSGSIGGVDGRKLERSKREIKYMGVVRENHFEPQKKNNTAAVNPMSPEHQTPMKPEVYTTYPLEKVGWHEQELSPRTADKGVEQLATPRPYKVDISRLVNLPPPYPRRHPALNNSHPKLSSYRSILQALRDRSLFEDSQRRISFGSKNANSTGILDEHLSNSIHAATNNLNELCCDLIAMVKAHDPTFPQEEGDDEPELLEKLTIAKRIFEAREQLYKDHFTLHDVSSGEFISRNKHKAGVQIRSAYEQRIPYEKLAAKRHREFQQTIHSIMSGGIEDQLSAFWDIAPSLVEVVRKVPLDLRNFRIEIPDQECLENPSYEEFPLQYFFTLLAHAEKSTYQFIDSQINLFCLLHEVKTAVANSRCRLIEVQWVLEGRDSAMLDRELAVMKSNADAGLTKELQGQVGVVEEQWKTALGNELLECKEKVKEYLQSTGGWVEGLGEYT